MVCRPGLTDRLISQFRPGRFLRIGRAQPRTKCHRGVRIHGIPGATEEVCIPIIEKCSPEMEEDFFVGYSPERINPGDKERTLTKIVKVVSGDTPKP